MEETPILTSLRKRSRPITRARLRYLGKSLYGTDSSKRQLSTESLHEAQRVLESATENESSAARETVALLKKRARSQQDVYEDNVSTDDDEPLPISLAMRPSHFQAAIASANRADAMHLRVRAAVRGITQGTELSREKLDYITEAVRTLADAFRQSSTDAPIRATLSAFTFDPPIAASTIRLAEMRSSALLQIYGELRPKTSSPAVKAISERAGLSLTDGAIETLTRTYGEPADLAEDPAQLADISSWIGGEVSRRALVAALRAQQTEILLSCMVQKDQRLAEQLIISLRSSRQVMAASPERIGDQLRIGPRKLHNICVAVFGLYPHLFNIVNGYVRHPYAAAAALHAKFGTADKARNADLVQCITLKYEAASEEELLRLFVALHTDEADVNGEDWKVLHALLRATEYVTSAESAVDICSKILHRFDNKLDWLLSTTPAHLHGLVRILSEADAHYIMNTVARASNVAVHNATRIGRN